MGRTSNCLTVQAMTGFRDHIYRFHVKIMHVNAMKGYSELRLLVKVAMERIESIWLGQISY